ncbi:hypothetical protein N9N28_10025 [Rubripirellula amarantea]|uniref:Uncharacterized protein n=1 Tax=Rubripirellula amarantea TaxID=2527999 RepID=A0A5C5WTA4_9BACT|nr:hypothetical protein [Rubripirellula amarantea]MDA8744956.1 hypothetical protein [Rubripirellula amarantea]TWT53385.1 hypothetical protein Pla22_10140 [Rubripirellula amarantea]
MHEINPYAPTLTEGNKPLELHRIETGVTSLSVFLHTLTGIVVAGGAFGASVFLFGVVASGGSGGSEMVFLLPIGLIVGAVLAGVSGTLTLMGMLAVLRLRGFLVPLNSKASDTGTWTPLQIKRFAAGAGAISGFAALTVPLRFESSSLLFALIPACFGLAGAVIAVRRCVRRAKDAITKADAKSPETPLSFDTPST